MLILVPAPMTKSPASRGDPVELGELSFPELGRERIAVLDAIAQPRLRSAPTTPARELYGGNLLKTALGDLSPEAEQRADEQLVFVSGLWGAVRPIDELPDYRVHMCERPAGLGHLVQYWQEPL
ncbi:MAG TPA: peroxide stress protein YaaA, partial [Pseudolysinimonas sp.]|nr:peroxide stress protein YaaA [Pseudolysinimonas sp.]